MAESHETSTNAAGESEPKLLIPGLIGLMAVMLMFRFNQNDWLVSRFTGATANDQGDASNYIDIVEFVRGNLERSDLTVPFAHRIFAPLLASVIPTAPMTALNIVGFLGLVVALLATLGTCRHIGIRGSHLAIAGFLFAFSFPLFYYGSIGGIEGVTLAILALGLYTVVADHWPWLIPLAVIGALTSAITVLMLVVAIGAASRSGNDRSRIGSAAVAAALFALTTVAIRWFMSDASGDGLNPAFETFTNNITRGRTLIALAGVLLPLVAIMLYGLQRSRLGFGHPQLFAFRVGLGAAAVALVVGLFTVYVDGRLAWMSYPYLVPLAALLLSAVANQQVLESTPIAPSAGVPDVDLRPAAVHVPPMAVPPTLVGADQAVGASSTGLPQPIGFTAPDVPASTASVFVPPVVPPIVEATRPAEDMAALADIAQPADVPQVPSFPEPAVAAPLLDADGFPLPIPDPGTE